MPALDDPADRAVGHELELRPAAVADLRGRHRAALDHRADALDAREGPFVEGHRVGVAGGLARRGEHGAHELDPVATRAADEDVARAAGVTGLDAVDERVLAHERVAVGERARPHAGLQRAGRRVHDLLEEAVRAQDGGQRHEVARTRVVRRRVEADRVVVVRVLEPELAGALVHLADERLRRAGHALRERHRRVVAGLQQQAAHQVRHLHLLARLQADLGLDRRRPVARRLEGLAQLRVLERQQGRHQLRRGADRAGLVGLARAGDDPGRDLDDDRARRLDRVGAVGHLGLLRLRGGGGRGRRARAPPAGPRPRFF